MKHAQADYINAGYKYEKATTADKARAVAQHSRHATGARPSGARRERGLTPLLDFRTRWPLPAGRKPTTNQQSTK